MAYTVTFDQRLAATTYAYLQTGEFANNAFDNNRTIDLLMARGVKETQSGTFVTIPLGLKTNSDVAYLGEGDTYTIGMGDFGSAAKWTWALAMVPIEYKLEEEGDNSGTEAIIRLVKAKLANAKASLTAAMNAKLFNTTGGSSNTPESLYTLIGTTTNGGISVSTFPNWVSTVDGTFGQITGKKIDGIIDSVTYDVGEPDLLIATQSIYQGYVDLNRTNLRFTQGDPANLGFQRVLHRNAVMSWDRDCTSGSVYAINSKTVKYVVNKGYDMVALPPKRSDAALKTHQEVVVRHQWVTNNRRSNGRLTAVGF